MNTNGKRTNNSTAATTMASNNLFLPPQIIGIGPSRIIPVLPLLLGLIESIIMISPNITRIEPRKNN
jgi:hypothetical protein